MSVGKNGPADSLLHCVSQAPTRNHVGVQESASWIGADACTHIARNEQRKEPPTVNYNIISIDEARSYATRDNAIKAVDRTFAEWKGKQRLFNVMIVRNTAGRHVPIICNIDPNHVGRVAWSGFLCVN